jgi:hypothetical protein
VYASYVMWREHKRQKYLPSIALSSYLRLLWAYWQVNISLRPLVIPLLPKVALSTKQQQKLDRDVSVSTFKRSTFWIEWLNKWVSYERYNALLSEKPYTELDVVIAVGLLKSVVTYPPAFLGRSGTLTYKDRSYIEKRLFETVKANPEWMYYYWHKLIHSKFPNIVYTRVRQDSESITEKDKLIMRLFTKKRLRFSEMRKILDK